MMKFFIHTTGCKANQWDSYVISHGLREKGFDPGRLADADVVVVNACTLTDGAERDARRFISRTRTVNRKAVVVLGGCHGQAYPDNGLGADIVLGHEEKFRVHEFIAKKGTFVARTRLFAMEDGPVNGLYSGRTRAFVKVQDGCDNFCAYCVVPFARGKPRSRPVKEIGLIMKNLREKGIKEVVLTGIELASFRDPFSGTDFKGLLRLLEEGDTPPRLRISSIDPLSVDDEFIDIVASSAKIARSLHVPLQSGSDVVLARMGRRYTSQFVGELLRKAQAGIETVGIGLDVIVGFPGETDDLFEETYRFIEGSDIYYLHVFPFSARKGTRAASWKDDVSETTKKERVRALRNLDATKRRKFYGRFLGTTGLIIPEGKTYRGSYMRGYTDNYLPVYIPFKKALENNLVKVRIKEIRDNLLVGEPVTE